MFPECVVLVVCVDNQLECVNLLSKSKLDNYVMTSNEESFYIHDAAECRQIDVGCLGQALQAGIEETMRNNPELCNNSICKEITDKSKENPINLLLMPLPVLFINPFLFELKESERYRVVVYKNLCRILRKNKNFFKNPTAELKLVIQVFSNDSYKIDYAWGIRLWRQIHLSIERECAAAWLSTLGGAFSALGEQSDKCAKMALKTSLKQIKLSVDSSDPDGVARGWLFLALALSQLGHSKPAFHLFNMAFNASSYDDRHMTMCLGVEVKLKYDRKVRQQRKARGILESPESLENTLKTLYL